MFSGCSSLTKTPKLLAKTLANNCYFYMFVRCSSLVEVSELSATTLFESCYGGMFASCKSLTKAPELPATTLAVNCYSDMFNNTGLIEAPTLPALTLTHYCYQSMFMNCANLNYIKMLATDVTTSSGLNNWVHSVPSTGIFVKAKDVEIPRGASGIPYGWTVIEE
jgi:hypothetical protein